MREFWLVAAGGACGAAARFGVGLAASRLLGASFPWGTLAVNVAGCLMMGVVMEVLLDLESQATAVAASAIRLQASLWRHGVAIGFLGGLTTFSSFGADTLRALASGQTSVALINVAANVLLSLAAVAAGMAVMRGVD